MGQAAVSVWVGAVETESYVSRVKEDHTRDFRGRKGLFHGETARASLTHHQMCFQVKKRKAYHWFATLVEVVVLVSIPQTKRPSSWHAYRLWRTDRLRSRPSGEGPLKQRPKLATGARR